MYKIRHIRSFEEFTNLSEPWKLLLAESPSNNYFLSWDWLWHWWNVYGKQDDSLTILLVEDGEEIIGIAPFYVRKRFLCGIYPVRRMMFLGTQEEGGGDVGSDYMNIICRAGEERRVADALFEAIAGKNICDEIYLSKMDASTDSFTLFQKKAEKLGFFTMITNEFISPYIQLPSTWDEYLNSLAPSMRYKIRKERRKFERCGTAVVRKVENLEDFSGGFEELIKLHKKRWEARGMEGAFSHPLFTEFHKRIMPEMLKRGQLDLILLSENGESKAILYNIFYNDKIYFYQSGIDTTNGKSSFGYLLHSRCIEDAITRGLKEYDFLPKGQSDDYKDRFSRQRRAVADVYMARQWAVKNVARAEELARSIYHRFKPHLLKVK